MQHFSPAPNLSRLAVAIDQILYRKQCALIIPINLEIKTNDILTERPNILARNPTSHQPADPYPRHETPAHNDLPIMLLASVILLERLLVLVVAHKSILEPLAALDRVGNRGPADHEARVQNRGQILQLPQLCRDLLFLIVRDICSKFE